MYLEYFHKYTFVCLLVQCFDSLSNLFKTRFEATKVDKVVVFFLAHLHCLFLIEKTPSNVQRNKYVQAPRGTVAV